jgi:hypothetical protein
MRSSIFILLLTFLVTRESNAKVAILRGLISELPSNPPSTALDLLLGIDEEPPTAAPVLGGGGHGQQIHDPSEFDEDGDLIDEPGDDEDEVLGGDGVDEEVAGMDEDIDEPTDSAGDGDIDVDGDEPTGDEDEGMDVDEPPYDETEAPNSAFGTGDSDAPSSSDMNPSPNDIPYPTLSPTMWQAPTLGIPPTSKPVIYVATDDDPLQQEDESIAEKEGQEGNSQTGGIGDYLYFDHGESLEEMEHDQNVAIALGVCFGIGLCLTIITAHQMMDNPDGCCASVCRIIVACQCAITRCVCFPCRLMCGCTGKGRNNQRYSNDLGYSRNQYSSDLELT